MFIIFFSLCIFLFTVTESRIVPFIVSGIIAIIRFARLLISPHKHFLYRQLAYLGISFLLAFLSRSFYNQRLLIAPPTTVFIGTGQITQDLGQQKYLFQKDSYQYILYAKTPHPAGSSLRLVGKSPSLGNPPLAMSFRPSQLGSESIDTENFSLFLSALTYSGFNQAKRLKMKGYAGIIYEDNAIPLSGSKPSQSFFESLRYSLRSRVISTYSHSGEQTNQTIALILGMLVGDKSSFSQADYQSFINSGLVHLVAVSGGNIVMLVTFLMAVLFFLPFYVRISVIAILVVGYGMICGLDSSVLRAVIMGCLSLIALLLGRRNTTRRALGISFVGMLCYNPYFMVYDVGFLLSFGAILGILLMESGTKKKLADDAQQDPKLSSKKPGMLHKIINRILGNYLKPTLGATLGIFPIIIFFMGKINIVSLFGNMLVLPFVPIIMIGGAIGLRLPSFLKTRFLWGENLLVSGVFIVSKYLEIYGIYLLVDAPRIKYACFVISAGLIGFLLSRSTEKRTLPTSLVKSSKSLVKPYQD